MGIDLPAGCRIETTIENHDWLSANTRASRPTTVAVHRMHVGGGNVAVARNIYRIVSYAHKDADIGKFKKKLLHRPDQEERTR